MTRKYVVGWLRFKPGKRDAFIGASRKYIETCRAEAGCLFFDFCLAPFDPDVATVMEGFASAEIHEQEHLKTPHFKTFWAALGEVCVEARFENILSDTVTPDAVKFG